MTAAELIALSITEGRTVTEYPDCDDETTVETVTTGVGELRVVTETTTRESGRREGR